MPEPLIRTKGVTKSYDKHAVLDGVAMTIPSQSVVGLLGKNGAGKSTLLKCMLGLLRIDDGEIKILGQDPGGLDAAAKSRIGYVPQEIEPYAWMTVQETADYTSGFYANWNQSFVRQTLADWDLDSAQRVKTLSRGQVQKLAIVLALGHEPDLLVLDEPAASLDPASRRDFLSMLVAMVSELGQTILFSTHITSDIERVCDRVAILRSGRIIYEDELDTLKERFKRIRLVSNTDFPRGLRVSEAIHTRVRGKEMILSVKNCTDELVDRLKQEWQASADVHDLNLEDIFLELHNA